MRILRKLPSISAYAVYVSVCQESLVAVYVTAGVYTNVRDAVFTNRGGVPMTNLALDSILLVGP